MRLQALCVTAFALAVAFFVNAEPAAAEKRTIYSPARFEAAEIKFHHGLPLVTVSGTPEEIGSQLGHLLKRPISELLDRHDAFAKGFGFSKPVELLLKTGHLMLPLFPEAHRRELQALVKVSGVDLDLLVFGNIMYELSRFPACSTIAVEPSRSASGNLLLGRNLDFPTFGFLDKYSLVVVYRPEGKHAFAAVTFPGFFGVASGMNDAGLCLAQLEVGKTSQTGPHINFGGTPVALCFRQLLEECETVDEAEKMLRAQKRFIMCNLALCDREQSVVLEITPKSVVRRNAEKGLSLCTNHFRSDELVFDNTCWRYSKLLEAGQQEKLEFADVAKYLHAVNVGKRTIQTMVFEPNALRIHLSLGSAPSSKHSLQAIDFAEFFRPSDRPAESVSQN
jgi:hypothetical protein